MAIFKCKMCGGDLNIIEGENVYECEYCGSKQTVPTADNEKKMTLFARANRLRFGCEFDKAASVYESIVAEFPEEAEAYWGLILCKYGIEYVDDPATGKKIPTCHRSSFESVMEDSNFEMVMEYSDLGTRPIYRDEAKEIERLRTGIIEVSSKEEPYDIFICYKETDPNGERTIDSVIAQDVYDALTEKGYRVFFSRITLEDKLGQEYEPYIFAALNSAKIMLAFGTDYEYYNAVWVKNEWSRFLQLIVKGEKKTLIPCYKGIDAYDMPKEFARLQAQDMGKVGAIQDLLRGIDKILPKQDNTLNQTIVTNVVNQNRPSVEPLLERAFMFLEDGQFVEANEYCEKVLDQDPKNARAYLGKLMVELTISKEVGLKYCDLPYDSSNNYQKAIRFGDNDFRTRLEGYVCEVKNRIKKEEDMRLQEEDAYLQNVIKAFQQKDNEKKKDELSQLKITEGKLRENLYNYDDNLSQVKVFEKDVATEESEIERLRIKRASLGIFAGKEKKQVDEQIETLKMSVTQTQEMIQQKKKEYGIDSTKEKLEQDLQQVRNSIEKREKTINKLDDVKSDFSFERAKAIFNRKITIRERIKKDYFSEYVKMTIKLAKERDAITFGKYDNHELEWLILDKQDNMCLVVTKEIVAFEKYNDVSDMAEPTWWEKCTLRRWLNGEFLNSAFIAEERQMIKEIMIKNNANPKYKSKCRDDTQDKVFLLSIEEAEKYFKNDEERVCKMINYPTDTFSWLLRSPGESNCSAAFVSRNGSVDYKGNWGNHSGGVRPAMWINLES